MVMVASLKSLFSFNSSLLFGVWSWRAGVPTFGFGVRILMMGDGNETQIERSRSKHTQELI